MIRAKDFKTYNKIWRKYFKRHDWWVDREGKTHNPQYRYKWRVWLSFLITDVETAKEALHHPKYTKGNLQLILNEYIEDYGKECYLDYGDKKVGTLYGVELTNEDYYWVIKYPDGKFEYESCVGAYRLVDENSK